MHNNQDRLNIALQYHKAGNIQEAETIYSQILQDDPENHMSLYFSGIIAYQYGNYDKATDLIYKAFIINPSFDYCRDLGDIYLESNNLDKAVEFYSKALNFDTQSFEVLNLLGKAYHKLNRFNESSNCFEKVLQLKPDYEAGYFNLGNLFKEINMPDGAKNCYLQAIKLKPDYIDAYFNLGQILKDQCNYIDAESCFRKVLEAEPDNAIASYNLGETLENVGKYDEAVSCYQKVIYMLPNFPHSYFRLGQIHLIREDFDRGWEYYEYRLKMRKPEHRVIFPKPIWDGSSLKNKTIYVHNEMGLGDSIMMARYLPVLNSMGAKVLCKPQKELEQLFKENDLKAEIIDNSTQDDSINFDTYIQFMSLPGKFKTNLENIPNSKGYLKANPEKVEYYRKNYFNNNNFKVGLVWHCKNHYPEDSFRSFAHISLFYDIARLQNIKLYSLQKGDGVEQLDNLPEDIEIINLGSTFNDFSDTAAAIENLDLLISIDTSVPHLAGAMGKPTWLLLSDIKDWKWFLKNEDCLWYDSVKLFRQKELGNWEEVMDTVYNSLNDLINR